MTSALTAPTRDEAGPRDRLCLLAFLVLSPARSAGRRGAIARREVARAIRRLPRTRGADGPAPDLGSPDLPADQLRADVVRRALGWSARPPLRPARPATRGPVGVRDETRLPAMSPAVRAAYALRTVEQLSAPQIARVLARAGVADPQAAVRGAEAARPDGVVPQLGDLPPARTVGRPAARWAFLAFGTLAVASVIGGGAGAEPPPPSPGSIVGTAVSSPSPGAHSVRTRQPPPTKPKRPDRPPERRPGPEAPHAGTAAREAERAVAAMLQQLASVLAPPGR